MLIYLFMKKSMVAWDLNNTIKIFYDWKDEEKGLLSLKVNFSPL